MIKFVSKTKKNVVKKVLEKNPLSKSEQRTMAKIDKIDFTGIRKKLCQPHAKGGYAWPRKVANEVIQEYKKFLFDAKSRKKQKLKSKLPVSAIPSQLVDIVWHTHILFTRQYHADCQKLFGKYMHHEPFA